jgi:mxaD protein
MRTSTKVVLSAAIAVFSLGLQAAESLKVSKEITVNAQPATVWKMVGNYNGLDVWHPVVTGSKIVVGQNDELGAIRELTLGNGAKITEKLLSHSDDTKQYSYEILESPLPVENYQSTITISDAGKGQSRIVWQSSFQAKGVQNQEAVNTISGVYDAGLNNVEAFFHAE